MTQEDAATNNHIRVRTFEWKHHTFPNGKTLTGWQPVNTPDSFYPGTGHLVAHDTMEHVSNGTSWKHEMLAFGATLYDRAPSDSFMMNAVCEDFLGFSSENNWEIPVPNKRWNKPLPGIAERQLQEMLTMIRSKFAQAILFDGIGLKAIPTITTTEKFAEVIARAEVWLRLGWRISDRLFFHRDGQQVFKTFRNIQRKVDHEFSFDRKFGDRLTVVLNRKNNTAAVSLGAI